MNKNLNNFDLNHWLHLHSQPATSSSTACSPDDTLLKAQLVAQQLISSAIDITQGYNNWVRLGFALSSQFGEEGRSLFHDLSRLNPQYSFPECDRKYSQCLHGNGQGITIATFFSMARTAGISIPRTASAIPPLSPSATPADPTSLASSNNGDKINNNINNITTISSSPATSLPSSPQLPAAPHHPSETGESGELAQTQPPQFFSTITDHLSISDLPPFFQEAISVADSTTIADILLLGTGFTLSSVMPSLFGIYDDRKVFPQAYLTIVGPAASGKGDVTICRHLVQPIQDNIRLEYIQQKEAYIKEQVAWASLDKSRRADAPAPTPPPYRSLFLSADSSTTSICQSLNDNGGFGLIFETEGVTMANALKTDYGNYSNVLCKAFQHEHISYTRRKENEHVDIESPRLALVATLTPGQVPILLPSYDSGLGSRISFYNMPRTLSWRNVFQSKERTSEEVFSHLGQLFFPVHMALAQRNLSPLQFSLSPSQQQSFNLFFGHLILEQVTQFGDDLTAVVRRLGLTTFRICMWLTISRFVHMDGLYPNPIFNPDQHVIVCDDRDFNTALTISNCLINHASYVYSSLVPPVNDQALSNVQKSLNSAKKQLLDSMPTNFSSDDFKKAALAIGISKRTAERYLGDLQGKHNLVQRVKNGHYRKILRE